MNTALGQTTGTCRNQFSLWWGITPLVYRPASSRNVGSWRRKPSRCPTQVSEKAFVAAVVEVNIMPTQQTMKSTPSSKNARLPLFEPAAEEQVATSPWNGPWWRPAPGEWPVLAWIILIHLTALVGLVLAPLPGWGLFFLSLAFIWAGGIGTTVCYHRAITHRSLKLHPVVRQALTFFAMFNGSGSPTT